MDPALKSSFRSILISGSFKNRLVGKERLIFIVNLVSALSLCKGRKPSERLDDVQLGRMFSKVVYRSGLPNSSVGWTGVGEGHVTSA